MPLINQLIQFIDSSPTAWHTAANVKKRLDQEGFVSLDETEHWKIKPGSGYYVIRSGSIIAFRMPKSSIKQAICLAAHTDSPGLKLKPSGQYVANEQQLLHFEVYGSPILPTWIGRELYLAGRIFYEDSKGKIQSELVSYPQFPVFIPNLALHLDRQVNEEGLLVDKQEHLSAMASSDLGYLEKLFGKKKVVHKELFAAQLEPPVRCGLSGEWLTASRLDNIASVVSCLEAFVTTKTKQPHLLSMIAFWNHEEIGSHTQEGAASPFFADVFERIMHIQGMNKEEALICKASSYTVSCDVAHAMHPNHPKKHDERHPVQLGKGICIKTNALERYVSPAELVAYLMRVFDKEKVAYQFYAPRNDIPSGSTIGPIHAAKTGFKSIDVGIPLLGMHAAREMIAVADYKASVRALKALIM